MKILVNKLVNKLKSIKHKKLMYGVIAVVILVVLSFPRLGGWLVAEDEIAKSDIIVVLMGSIPDRVLEAADIYSEGYSDELVMVNSHMVGYDDLLERGVEIPGHAQVTHMAADSLGVNTEDVTILPGEAKSTQDEAVIIREYLREHEEINSMILVTSKYHSSRSKKILTKALDDLDREINVISRPSKYDNFDSDNWWKEREDIARVVTEYLKYINYYVREQFQL